LYLCFDQPACRAAKGICFWRQRLDLTGLQGNLLKVHINNPFNEYLLHKAFTDKCKIYTFAKECLEGHLHNKREKIINSIK